MCTMRRSIHFSLLQNIERSPKFDAWSAFIVNNTTFAVYLRICFVSIERKKVCHSRAFSKRTAFMSESSAKRNKKIVGYFPFSLFFLMEQRRAVDNPCFSDVCIGDVTYTDAMRILKNKKRWEIKSRARVARACSNKIGQQQKRLSW